MDYLNPTSIAQMAQVPKDTSLPGTGYGLVQGFNEGQAMMRAKDFLDMSKATQAQNYVRNQFDMQSKWTDYPLDRQIKEQSYEQGQQNLAKTKYDFDALQKKTKKEGTFEHMRLAGGAADAFRNAKTDLERRAVYEQMRKAHEMAGIPVDEDLHFEIGNPESTARVQQYLDLARDIVSYSPDTLGAIAANDPKIKASQSEGAADRASREKMNREDNETQLRVAGISAAAHQAIAAGSNAWGNFKVRIGEAWFQVKQKPEKDWTPTDKAIAVIAPQVLAPAPFTAENFSQNAGVQGRIAGQRTEDEMKALKNVMTPGAQSDAFSDPSKQVQVNPGKADMTPQGTSLEDRLNRYNVK